MAHHEHSMIQGVLTLELRDRTGARLEVHTVHNLITTAGKSLLASLLAGRRLGAVELVIGVGEGNDAAAVTNTALGKKTAEAAATISEPVKGADGASVSVTVEANISAGGAGDAPLPLTEAGILVRIGADPVGVLFNRVTFPVINKGPTMSLLLSWELTF
jgi:hypothetical protein